MTIDIISITVCIFIALLVACSTTLANPFFRRIGKSDNAVASSVRELPQITVLVLANNNADALDSHLPSILTQDYDIGYEVVVVGEKGDLPTEAVIDKYAHNKKLYATYIPHHSLFMSKEKLAVALGVKAAHNEWIVMVNAECKPQSDLWLKKLAENMDNSANMVIGYSNYVSVTNSFYRFERLRTFCYLVGRAKHGTAYRTNGTNIAFRKSEFIEKDGFRGNLQLANGEYDFIVNKYARQGGTRVVINTEATIHEDKPTKNSWHNRNIYYAHIRRFLKRSAILRFIFNIDMTAMLINYIVLIAAITTSAIIEKWIVLAVSIFGLIVTVAVRSVIAKKIFAKFGEDISGWKTILYEIFILFHNIATLIHYSRTNKYDFTTHKI